ncbi:MAG TPA: type II secretion system F family protein [bacterium]|jgi:Flp pilus assembly protein TadB|nr:type II secretion system F family protein [bacterium]
MNAAAFRIFLIPACAALSAGLLGYFITYHSFVLFPEVRKKFPQFPKSGMASKMTEAQKVMALGLLLGLSIMALYDFFTGLVVLTAAVFCGYGLEKGPGLLKKSQLRKRQAQMAEVFPQTLGMSIQALKTGQTMPQVLSYLSREAPSALRGELSQVCAEMDMGSSSEQALTQMAERFPDFSEFSQFVESYKISRQTGANLTHLLEVLLEGMEEKSRILRKMGAMTAQARLSGLLMGSLPFLLGLVFFFMDPNLMEPLFTEKAGWAILILAAVLESIGFLWIRQLLQVEF